MNKTENQLWELERICIICNEEISCSNWVLYAISRHIYTGRATKEYEDKFSALTKSQLIKMVKYCLDRGKSDDEIIANTKKFMRL